MDEVEFWDFESAAELAEQAAGDIAFVIESAVEAHGGARIALPPAAPDELYDALLAAGIDWPKVAIVPTHESEEEDEALGRLEGEGASLIALEEQSLAGLAWPLDLACLSVGEDGRVAGLRPGPELDRGINAPRERRVLAGARGATLTGPAIISARAIMIIASGAAQRETIERAIKDGPLSALPIGRLLADADASVDILWTA